MLIDELLLRSAGRYPDKPMLVHGHRRTMFGEAASAALKVAGALMNLGVKRGDRVIIALENSFEYLASFFGVLAAGGVTVAITPLTSAAGFLKTAADCSPTLVIAGPHLLKYLPSNQAMKEYRFIAASGAPEPVKNHLTATLEDCISQGVETLCPGRTGRDLASIIYTSGTTGQPKGVMLSHSNLTSNANSIVEYLRLTNEDSVMAVLPFHYSYGNSLLLTHAMQGASIIAENQFIYPNVVLETMLRESPTGFAGVPSTFAILCHKSNFRTAGLKSLRYMTQAGGAMPHALALEVTKAVPHAKLYIMYGQTEAAARLSFLPPEDLFKRPGSIGKAIPGVLLEVLNDAGEPVKPGEKGEIVASGPNIMLGYWGNEEETSKVLQKGKLHTGDLATIDEDGYIYIVGRNRDMIKCGAHRIAPKEIEEVIMEHSSVFEAAVVGQEDPILGEAIAACVVLKEGRTCAEAEILKLCQKKLPPFKIPKRVLLVDSLPKTESGKVKKEELRNNIRLTRGIS